MLSAVDNRRDKRILYDVLDHDPTHDDIRVFLRRVHTALSARALTLLRPHDRWLGTLYPTPLVEVFGDVPHQLCTLHIVAEGNKAVLGAVASARKGLAATQPTLPKGRPRTQAAKAAARTKKRLTEQCAALFTHRYLFVQRHLSKTERKTLGRISRRVAPVTCAACDPGTGVCVVRSALSAPDRPRQAGPVAAARPAVHRPLSDTLKKKRFAPTLEKALTLLDDKLLPSTSNAVERANRRYRQIPKQGLPRAHASPDPCPTWHWICGVKPKPKAGNKPLHHFIVHGLDKPGSSATAYFCSI